MQRKLEKHIELLEVVGVWFMSKIEKDKVKK